MDDLLFLCHRIPYPPNKGDKIRSWHMLEHLARHYRVALGCFVDDPADRQYEAKLRQVCDQAYFATLNPTTAKLRGLAGLATGQPLSLGFYRDSGLGDWVRRLAARRRPDKVFVFSSTMAPYALLPALAGARRVVDMVDVDSDKWRQYATRKAWPARYLFDRESRTLLDFERAIARQVDATILVSVDEAALFRRLAPESAARVHHVNNGVDLDYFAPGRDYADPYPPGRRSLVFTGAMDYWPNVDAVVWFVEEILPRMVARIGDLAFTIVGSKPAREVRRLARDPRVTVTGRVPDVRPYLAHAAAVVVPLRVARGVQNKVLEGLAMARPVVATPQALEGLEIKTGPCLRRGGDADDFARQIVDVIAGTPRRAGCAEGRRAVERAYEWDANLARLDRLLAGPEDRAAGQDATAPSALAG